MKRKAAKQKTKGYRGVTVGSHSIVTKNLNFPLSNSCFEKMIQYSGALNVSWNELNAYIVLNTALDWESLANHPFYKNYKCKIQAKKHFKCIGKEIKTTDDFSHGLKFLCSKGYPAAKYKLLNRMLWSEITFPQKIL